MAEEEIYASVRVVGGGVSPDEITERLNVAPSRAWRKDEPFVDVAGKLRERYNGLWLYDAKGLEFKSPVEHVRHVMDMMKGRIRRREDGGWGDAQVDLCLWIAAPEMVWSIAGQDIGQMIEEGYDGINVSFVGLDDGLPENGNSGGEGAAKAQISLCSTESGGIVCSVTAEGGLAECIEKVLAEFVQKLKAAADLPPSRISIEWIVSHGALYIGREDMKLFRDIGCCQLDFMFRNA